MKRKNSWLGLTFTAILLGGWGGTFTFRSVSKASAAHGGASHKEPEWHGWRGPEQTGMSRETGLVDSWSPEGENLLWKAPIGGRSTPVVLNERVYIITLGGKEKLHYHERIVCLDAKTGKVLWEHGFNVFLTDIPWHRVGWSSLAADPETGYIYAHGIGGIFLCLDKDSKVIWERSLTEEYGRISGYGGRTHTPVVDENLVILSYLSAGWGNQARGAHRYFAFDKKTGEQVWVSQPGGRPLDTNYSVPVVTVINGQRLLIAGNADGAVYAMKVRTGEKVWGFRLSKRGINSSVVVEGNRVYASHSEENVDSSTAMGRLVAIDATGTGDVTETHEVWKVDGFVSGYASPAVHDGKLYHVDNSANLHAFDSATGRELWKQSIGTVQKGSPVWADGKIYVSEVDGKFYILKPGENDCEILDKEEFLTTTGAAVQINSSPAIANGRLYLLTRNALYCIGKKGAQAKRGSMPKQPSEGRPRDNTPPAHLQVTPAEVVLQPGQSRTFKVRAFDAKGRALGKVKAEWNLQNLKGNLQKGKFEVSHENTPQAGSLTVKAGDLAASARVRVIPPIPLQEDFEGVEVGKVPAHWIAAPGKFVVEEEEQNGNRVLKKLSRNPRFWRTSVFIGQPAMSGYTVQADMKAAARRRRSPDMGVIANRYVLNIKLARQELQIRSWHSELRMAKTIPFTSKPDVWYRMKMRVNATDSQAVIRGKVWPREEPEPKNWTLEVEDPRPNREGSPGIYGWSSADIFYDNILVTKNTP